MIEKSFSKLRFKIASCELSSCFSMPAVSVCGVNTSPKRGRIPGSSVPQSRAIGVKRGPRPAKIRAAMHLPNKVSSQDAKVSAVPNLWYQDLFIIYCPNGQASTVASCCQNVLVSPASPYHESHGGLHSNVCHAGQEKPSMMTGLCAQEKGDRRVSTYRWKVLL